MENVDFDEIDLTTLTGNINWGSFYQKVRSIIPKIKSIYPGCKFYTGLSHSEDDRFTFFRVYIDKELTSDEPKIFEVDGIPVRLFYRPDLFKTNNLIYLHPNNI